jgi:hypothetical protein
MTPNQTFYWRSIIFALCALVSFLMYLTYEPFYVSANAWDCSSNPHYIPHYFCAFITLLFGIPNFRAKKETKMFLLLLPLALTFIFWGHHLDYVMHHLDRHGG